MLLKVIISRLLQVVILLIGISFLVFSSMHLAPGDPAEMVAGVTATAQDIQQVRDNLGLDASFIVQYGCYLSNVAQGDLPNPPFDCPFYIRCPIAQNICSEQKPRREAYHETHYVACHFKDASKLEVI